MTLPDERYRAVKMARQFLQELMDMMQVCEVSPHIFQTQMEDVTRLFRRYEQAKDKKDEA